MPGTWSCPMMWARSSGTPYFCGQVSDQLRRALVERLGVPVGAGGREALVLQADRVHVHVPVAGVPRDVGVVDVLGDVAVDRPERVVPRDVRRVADEIEGGVVGRLGVVDDDVLDVHVLLPVGEVVVAVGPRRLAVVLVRRGEPLAVQSGRAVRATAGHSRQTEPRNGQLVDRRRGARTQRHALTVVGGARLAGADDLEDLLGEPQCGRLVVGAAVARDRGGPVTEVLGSPGLALVVGQHRRATADVGDGVALQPPLADAGQLRGRCQRGECVLADPLAGRLELGGRRTAALALAHRVLARRRLDALRAR